MSKSSSMSRAVATWIAIGSALWSCARTGETGKSSETASATPATVGAKADTFSIDPKDVYDESWKTPLPDGVNGDADSFRAQLKRTMAARFPNGGKHQRLRAGKNCSGCAVNVEISAISPTRPIDSAIPPVPGPRAVALLQNLDPANTEAYYGLKPRKNADYYFWIDARGGRSRITVLEVPPSGSVHAGKQKYLGTCHKYPHNDTTNFGDADFAEYRSPPCDGYASGMSKESLSSFPFSVFSKMFARVVRALHPPPLIAADGWIDCNSGCCW